MTAKRALFVFGMAILALAPLSSARADDATAAGWWLNRDGNVPDAVMPPPNVPPGGLYVAANVTGEQGISAVRFALSEGVSPQSLTLKLSSSSGTIVLDACPAAAPWRPVSRGAWSDRPKQDCGDSGNKKVAGTVSPDASSVTFRLSPSLVTDGLDLVIVPGIDPTTSTTAVFDAVFNPPTSGSLAVSRASSSESEQASTTPAPSSSPATIETSSPPPVSTPENAAAPTPQTEDKAASAAAPVAAFDAARGSSNGRSDNGTLSMSGPRRAGVIAVALVAVLLLLFVNRQVLLERAGLTVAGNAPPALLPSQSRVVGVGRFARPRKGPAPPL